MSSVFVTGTDTDVGKTFVAAGLAAALREMGLDVGVMKPYSAGTPSNDIDILAEAAGVAVDDLMNPAHQELAAPPYSHYLDTGQRPDPSGIIARYRSLAASHGVMVVEGMGGSMVPILRDYYMVDLARDMDLPVLVVAGNRVGSINHIVMTTQSCRSRGAHLRGVVLNMIHDGYGERMMRRDLDALGVTVLGAVPRLDRPADLGRHMDVRSALGG